jgi:hypothetical protein
LNRYVGNSYERRIAVGFKELRVVEKLLRLNRYVGNSYERRIAVENNY